jgi:hypothetical protein
MLALTNKGGQERLTPEYRTGKLGFVSSVITRTSDCEGLRGARRPEGLGQSDDWQEARAMTPLWLFCFQGVEGLEVAGLGVLKTEKSRAERNTHRAGACC